MRRIVIALAIGLTCGFVCGVTLMIETVTWGVKTGQLDAAVATAAARRRRARVGVVFGIPVSDAR